jgi:hypothetical protein
MLERGKRGRKKQLPLKILYIPFGIKIRGKQECKYFQVNSNQSN